MNAISQSDLLALIASIIKANPGKSKADHEVIFQKWVFSKGHEGYLIAGMHRAYTLLYNNAYKAVHPPTTEQLNEQARIRSAEAAEDERLLIGAKRLLMQRAWLIVSKLTGAEAIRLGGVFIAVGERVGLGSVVGEVMSEEEFYELTTLPNRAQPPADQRLAP